MQKMSDSTDTHDHGPPSSSAPLTDSSAAGYVARTPFPRVAIWSTTLSSAGVNSFSGAMAGIASGVVTCPLDVIKTKLQLQGAFASPGAPRTGPPSSVLYHGLAGTARTIVRQDGFRGLYRGLGPMLLGYLPTWAVYMSVYDSSREYYYAHGYGEKERDRWLARVFASLTAGSCSTLATNPIWVIKTRLMSQVSRKAVDGIRPPWHYTSTLDAARKMYRVEGIGAFYSGLAPALLGLTHVAIQFPLYEFFKQQFTGLEMGAAPADHGEAGMNTIGVLAATFVSKICATSATYPHEVLRTRMQTQQRLAYVEHNADGLSAAHSDSNVSAAKRAVNTDGHVFQPRYRGILQTFRLILREEGWRAFYNGMGTNMIRAVPAAMTTMLTFESLKGFITNLQEEGKALQRAQGLV